MPAYLKFFELERSPFEADSPSRVVLGTKALRDALAAIRSGLDEGAARICVNGQAGLGKTSLARALPKLLDEASRVAVILQPSTSWNTIRSSLAKQWKVGEGGLARSNLLTFARDARLVLVVDQAEAASTDVLDHLDVLLSYRSETDEPVVQSVLFANLTRQATDEPPPLIWWLDRIQTLELQFAPLPREGVGSYIHKHLKRAGWRSDSLFTDEASYAIHGYTGGIPGEVDRVCELLLNQAAKSNMREIDALFVHEILDDQAEENSNTYDTFEELVMEDAFDGADRADEEPAANTPSLQETLEHFASAELDPETTPRESAHFERAKSEEESGHADAPDRIEGPTLELVTETHPDDDALDDAGDNDDEDERLDASLLELEAYLSRPPSEEELRAIRTRGLGRTLRVAAVLALALTICGLMIQWLGDSGTDSGASDSSASTPTVPALPHAVSHPTLFANPEGLSAEPSEPPPLARLRGPVNQGAPTKVRDERPTVQPGATAAPNASLGPADATSPVPAAPDGF